MNIVTRTIITGIIWLTVTTLFIVTPITALGAILFMVWNYIFIDNLFKMNHYFNIQEQANQSLERHRKEMLETIEKLQSLK